MLSGNLLRHRRSPDRGGKMMATLPSFRYNKLKLTPIVASLSRQQQGVFTNDGETITCDTPDDRSELPNNSVIRQGAQIRFDRSPSPALASSPATTTLLQKT
ncbi:hypothetical protein ACLOJK_007018 [Asimina triloba]